MKVARALVRELIGLFIDDGALALSIVGVVGAAALLAAEGDSDLAGALLLVGCLGVLLVNVARAARR